MMKIEIAVDMRLKNRNVPAEILMEPKCLSMVKAWTVERLLTMAIVMLKRMPVDHSGMILSTFFRSSTSSTVHKFHDFE